MRFLMSSWTDSGRFWKTFGDNYRTYSYQKLYIYKTCFKTTPPSRTLLKSHAFWDQKPSNIHEEIGSGTLLVPKSRFYRFYMDFGIQNDLLLVTLGPIWFTQGDLGARFGDPLGPNTEKLTKHAPKCLQSHQNNLPKSSKWPPKVTKTWTLMSYEH